MTYRFSTFSLDVAARQLLRGGEEVHLSPKAFELLLLLMEQRARAVSKAELQDRLWPSTFVTETNLATLIAEVRRALGDSAQQSRYVRTLQRFGYRFVAHVTELAPDPMPSGPGVRMSITGADREFPLVDGANVIGRGREAQVRVDSGSISRLHARIDVMGSVATIEDLGSKNGTCVDGRSITGATLLQDGAEIRVGAVVFTFRISSTTQVTETMG